MIMSFDIFLEKVTSEFKFYLIRFFPHFSDFLLIFLKLIYNLFDYLSVFLFNIYHFPLSYQKFLINHN
jgi:hypothetical protein